MTPTRVALVTHNLESAGGIRTLTNFLCRVLAESGRYRPEIVSLSASADDDASVLLRKPSSWRTGVRVNAGNWREFPMRHVGARISELEFQRYRPRQVLTELLSQYDLVQFVVGTPPWACVGEEVDRPLLLWTASTIRSDRKSRLQASTGIRRSWSQLMTRTSEIYERRALKRVDTVFALSEYTREAVRPQVEPERLVLAPCGVDTDLFHPVGSPAGQYVLGVARFHDPRKNLPLLLRAYARARRAAPSIPDLYLVGEVVPESAQQMLRDLNIQSHVRLSGVLTRAELVEAFQNAALFVLSSDEEGLGIPVLEAMASGVPVVSTACGGPETAILHGETGLLTPVGDENALADAMQRLLGDPALHARIRGAAREAAAQRFSVPVVGRIFLDRYEQTLAHAGSRRTVAPHGATGAEERARPERMVEPTFAPVAAAEPATVPVSVIVPFFNGYETIGRVLRSLERQTFRPREILIVDDGSRRPLLPREVACEVPVRVIRLEENRGIPAARNLGVREAAEEWIAFLDHDDEWLPHKIERQWAIARALQEPERGSTVLYGRCVWVEPAERKVELFPGSDSVNILQRGGAEAVRELLVRGLSIPFITVLAHRTVFKRHGFLDERVKGGSDDYEIVLRWAAQGVSFVTADFDEPDSFSALYHMGEGNYSRGPWFLEEERLYLERLVEANPDLRAAAQTASARSRFRAGRIFERRGEKGRAAREYRQSILLDWRSVRPWLALLTLRISPAARRHLEMVWRRRRSANERVELSRLLDSDPGAR